MALSQDKTGKVWIITGTEDNVDTTIHTGPIWFSKIHWMDVTAAGHDLVVKDSDGTIIIDENAIAGATTGIHYTYTDFACPYNGLVVNTMDSGTLLIFVE